MSKQLKSQVENRVGQLIRNRLPGLDLGPIRACQHPPCPSRPQPIGPRATPPGGAPRAQGLPLAQRPAPLSGPREVRT